MGENKRKNCFESFQNIEHCSAVELADLISSDLVEVYLLKILHTPTPPSLTHICIISYGAEFLA